MNKTINYSLKYTKYKNNIELGKLKLTMSENKQNHIKKVRDYKRSTITRPLSEMEVIDLMIYGDDVLISNKDNKNIFSDK